MAFCISDHHDAPARWVRTASFVYVRGHRPGGTYAGSYDEPERSRWASHIRTWRGAGRAVYAYFDNDTGCAAPGDARRLREMVG